MKWYNFDEIIRREKYMMKKLLTTMFVIMLSLTATKTTLASEVTVHDPNIQVIVEEGNSLLSKSMKNVDHYEDVYSRASITSNKCSSFIVTLLFSNFSFSFGYLFKLLFHGTYRKN